MKCLPSLLCWIWLGVLLLPAKAVVAQMAPAAIEYQISDFHHNTTTNKLEFVLSLKAGEGYYYGTPEVACELGAAQIDIQIVPAGFSLPGIFLGLTHFTWTNLGMFTMMISSGSATNTTPSYTDRFSVIIQRNYPMPAYNLSKTTFQPACKVEMDVISSGIPIFGTQLVPIAWIGSGISTNWDGIDAEGNMMSYTHGGAQEIVADQVAYDMDYGCAVFNINPLTPSVCYSAGSYTVSGNLSGSTNLSVQKNGSGASTPVSVDGSGNFTYTYNFVSGDAGQTITLDFTAQPTDTDCSPETETVTLTVNTCPTTVALNLKVFLQGVTPDNGVCVMTNYIQEPDPTWVNSVFSEPRLPMTDPYGVGVAYADINDPFKAVGKVVDWVKVEIWGNIDISGWPYKYDILEVRALLLKPDGSIVDIDGKAPQFEPQTGPVQIVIKHRNHLAVMSQPLADLSADTNYDFSDGLGKAYILDALYDPAPMVSKNGVWCMWAGDINDDGIIDAIDAGVVSTDNTLAIYSDDYFTTDIDMNGEVNTFDVVPVATNNWLNIWSPVYNFYFTE